MPTLTRIPATHIPATDIDPTVLCLTTFVPFGDRIIEKVIFNDPATIVYWGDGTNTVVKCQDGDTFDKELGLAMAICKKHFGNKGRYNNEFKKWVYGDD